MSGRTAKKIYESIWEKFAADRKISRATAYANLQKALCEHAADLVPDYLTAREHMTMVADMENFSKGDKASETGDPLSNMSSWIRGDLELSRIPLETSRKN